MSALADVRVSNAAALESLSFLPIALFIGGTSGIGRAAAQAFARYTNGKAHIVIIGRNAAAAAATIASFPPPPAGATHEFAECDASLMANVRDTAAALRARLPRVHFVVLSAGYAGFGGRADTAEGLDRRLALSYYARWAFARALAPLLGAAAAAGEPASVLSVLSAGLGGAVDVGDLGLHRAYTFASARAAMSTYNDLMIEEFARRFPAVAFTHMFPGTVRTPLLLGSWAAWLLWSTLLRPLTVSPNVCAEYVLDALLSAQKGKGIRRGPLANDIGASEYVTEEARTALWTHTEKATGLVPKSSNSL